MPPKLIKVTAAYRTPLTRGLDEAALTKDPLRVLKRELLNRLKNEILGQTTFSRRAKISLSKSLKAEIHGSTLRVSTDHPAWKPLVEGQHRGQMQWLVRAKHPIPIIREDGSLIFRSATPKSMADGKWVHPGRQPTKIVDRAKKAARKFAKDKLAKELVKAIRSGR